MNMTKINKVLVVVSVFGMILSMGCVGEPAPQPTPQPTPQYKTIERSEPIYASLSTIELDDDGDGNAAWIYTNVYSINKTYTGTDFWGNKNYNVDVYYYIGTQKTRTPILRLILLQL